MAITGGEISCGGVTIGSGTVVVGDTHTPVPFSGISPMPRRPPAAGEEATATPSSAKSPSPAMPELPITSVRPSGAASARAGAQLRSGTPAHQGGAGTSGVTSPQPPEMTDESGRTLRLGVFFDGTGNHKDNDRRLPDRDVTNVVKLHGLYRETANTRRVYVPGPGTIDGEQTSDGFEAPEDRMGLGLGIGPEGGHDRIEFAISRMRDEIHAGDYDEVVFDVFGFSRGAALARHFVNLVNEQPESILLPRFSGAALTGPAIGFRRVPVFPPGLKVRVNFVGLFDTVGSFYLPGFDASLDFNLNLAPGSARRVVHLSAYHEIRKNFPLSSVMDAHGDGPSHFTEIAVPGVHSDVGGGYENPDQGFENIEKIVLGIHSGLADGGHTQRTAIPQLEQQYAQPGRTVVAVPQPNGDIHVQERRRTRKELAIYNLHRMYGLAKQSDVPLRQMNTDDKDYHVPQDLQDALASWQGQGESLAVARDYLGGYIHTSHCIYALGMAPEPSGKRRVLYNRPAQAITPSKAGVARAQ